MAKVSMSYFFFSSEDIKQSSYLDSWRHHKLQNLSWIKLSRNGWQRGKIQKFEYLKNKKSSLDQIKNIFHSFWRSTIWWKMKTSEKIADIFFNKYVCYCVLQQKLLTDLSPRIKMFSRKCNHHVHRKGSAKKLHSISDIKLTVSVKNFMLKEPTEQYFKKWL